MNLFDYVVHEGRICILVDFDDEKATLLYICYYEDNSACFATVEYNADINDITPYYGDDVTDIMERLRSYRMSHDDSFGFAEEEMSLIHFFR